MALEPFVQLIYHLKQNHSTFRKSEKILADWILQNPQKTTKLTIKGLSFLTQVSEPSIVRFCRRVGAKGYADFKLRLTENLASGQTNSHLDLAAPIAPGALRNHLIDTAKQALTECKLELSDEAIEYAIYQLNTAKSLVVVAVGEFESFAMGLYVALWSKVKQVALAREPEHLNKLKPEKVENPWCFLIDDGSALAQKMAILATELGYRLFILGSTHSAFEKTADIAWCFSQNEEAFGQPLHFQMKVTAAIEILKHGVGLECEGKLQKRLAPPAKNKSVPLGVQSELW